MVSILTPVKPEAEGHLDTYLAGLRPAESPFGRVAAIHVARCVVVGQIRSDFAGAPRVRRRLRMRYLFFTAVHDGSCDELLRDMRSTMQPELALLWGCCVACPSTETPEFDDYMKHNVIPIRQQWAAHDLTVGEVRAALELRRRHSAFATESRGIHPAQLLGAFNAEFRP